MIFRFVEKKNLKKALIALGIAAILIGIVAVFNRSYAGLLALSFVSDEAAVIGWTIKRLPTLAIILTCSSCNLLRTFWLFYILKLDETNGMEEKVARWQYRLIYQCARVFPAALLALTGVVPALLCPLPVIVTLMKILERFKLGIKKQDAVALLWLGGTAKIIGIAISHLGIRLSDIASHLLSLFR